MTNLDTTALLTSVSTLTASHRAAYEAAMAEANEQAAIINRLALAEMLLGAELPRTAVVEMMDWAEEPNPDGTYDVDLSEAYDTEDEDVDYGDLGGTGAISAGHHDGDNDLGTDWDLFLDDGEVEPGEFPRISVAKVYDWLGTLTA